MVDVSKSAIGKIHRCFCAGRETSNLAGDCVAASIDAGSFATLHGCMRVLYAMSHALYCIEALSVVEAVASVAITASRLRCLGELLARD